MIFNFWEVSIKSIFFKNVVSYDVKIKRVFETHCEPNTDRFISLKRCSSHVLFAIVSKNQIFLFWLSWERHRVIGIYLE